MRTTLKVGLWLVTFCGGCAHATAESGQDTRATSEPAVARLRQENAELKRRVQMLEDRVLRLERDPEGVLTAEGRNLPVVQLQPPHRSKDASRVHTASPARGGTGRRAVSLDPLPHSGEPDPVSADDGQWEIDDGWSAASDTSSRTYRLVGAHLVEQTKTKGPSGPDRPQRDAKGRGIVAEYEAAMAIYKSGDFVQAEQAFEAFARRHPDHDYADNALYWKGEAAYDQQHYADALAAFTEVVERYGGGNKAPDALLKIGLCYEKVGDLANAADVLTQLVAAYPRARASDIARARLAEIGA